MMPRNAVSAHLPAQKHQKFVARLRATPAWLPRLPGGHRWHRERQASPVRPMRGVVDGKARFPLKPLGLFVRPFRVVFVLGVNDLGLQVIHVLGNLRFHGIPVSARLVVGRLDLLVYLVDRLGRRRVCFFLENHDLVVRLLLCRVESVFGALGVSR
jgi:hypothetical protein